MEKKYLPLSKSWAIRMIVLDMKYGEKYGYKIINYFKKQNKENLSYDIQSALRCAISYISGKKIMYVGDSGTLCRFLICILYGGGYKIRMRKQLKERMKNERIPQHFSPRSLRMTLARGTSQYISAALLMDGDKSIINTHPKCLLSMEARKVYFENNGRWIPRYDEVIIGQLCHFLYGDKIENPIAEDYCHLRAFNLVTQAEGKRRWPELANHECDRLKVMEEICKKGFNRLVRVPEDHRVIMAVALRQISLGFPIRVTNKKYVNKSFPLFWEWLKENT